jgi:hypothetical protein
MAKNWRGLQSQEHHSNSEAWRRKHYALEIFWGLWYWRTHGAMAKDVYINILANHLKKSATNLELGRRFVFQQANDSKHISHKAKNWIKDNKIQVLEWFFIDPDLNPIEKLNPIVARTKLRVRKRNPKNINELEQFFL